MTSKIPAILWLMVAMTGLGVQLTALYNVRSDKRFQQSMGYNGRIRIMAQAHVRNAWIRTCCLIADVFIGLLVITEPAASDRVPKTSSEIVIATTVAVVLIGIEVGLICMTWFEQRDRRNLLRTFIQPTDHHADAADDHDRANSDHARADEDHHRATGDKKEPPSRT